MNRMGESYNHNDYMSIRMREKSDSAREIGSIPLVRNPGRRARCEFDLAAFLKEYLPQSFPLAFSKDHLRVIARLQEAILTGGRFIEAVYRGFGKSTITEGGAEWAVCYGHRRFIQIIAADQTTADNRLSSIKMALETSEELFADFPEICHPVRKLEGIPQRAAGQMCGGSPTGIEWKSNVIVMPTVEAEDARACGSIIMSCGLTSSRARGPKHTRQDGVQLRPDFAVIDDPQTNESAANPAQVAKRLEILNKAILQTAGHTKSLAAVIACTVIEPEDMIARLLDPEQFTSWEGERISLVKKWADRHDDLWLGKYKTLRTSYDKQIEGDRARAVAAATAFYLANRAEMDAGCVVSWDDCHDETEISAIQHAYNKFIDNPPGVFASEYQNQPLSAESDDNQLTMELLSKRLNRLGRCEIPAGCSHVAGFVDVQQKCFYYVVTAWRDDFTGYIVDYGVFPDQKKPYFTLRDITKTLQWLYPGNGQEGSWRAGLEDIADRLVGREYIRDDGAILRMDKMLIDANDGNARDVIYEFCRQSKYPSIVMPAESRGVKAGDKPFAEYVKKPGDKKGLNWRIPATKGRREARHVLSDVNFWKSFVRSRWATAMGDVGGLSLFGDDVARHRMFFDHMLSEFSTRTEGRGRVVDEWRVRPNNTENHWWDCVVGCAIAASVIGCELPGMEIAKPVAARPKLKLSELAKSKSYL